MLFSFTCIITHVVQIELRTGNCKFSSGNKYLESGKGPTFSFRDMISLFISRICELKVYFTLTPLFRVESLISFQGFKTLLLNIIRPLIFNFKLNFTTDYYFNSEGCIFKEETMLKLRMLRKFIFT